MATYHLDYGFGHLQADCQGLVSMGGATGGCGGGVNVPPTFGISGVQGGTDGRSNENDFCFYSRQSLFSIVQVTEFQLP